MQVAVCTSPFVDIGVLAVTRGIKHSNLGENTEKEKNANLNQHVNELLGKHFILPLLTLKLKCVL